MCRIFVNSQVNTRQVQKEKEKEKRNKFQAPILSLKLHCSSEQQHNCATSNPIAKVT
jgi:hypothetical protein